MNEMTHFDKSINWYDSLSSFVFGNRLRQMERELIPHLPNSGTILWIGGGSGQILPEMIAARPSLEILYLDTSEKMIGKAKRRLSGTEAKVSFFTSLSQITRDQGPLEAVLLFYVLDVFNEKELQEILPIWNSYGGKKTSVLLVADFDYPMSRLGNLFARLLIPLMYVFFRLSIQIPTKKLPDWKKCLRQSGYTESSVTTSLMGVLRSGCWRTS